MSSGPDKVDLSQLEHEARQTRIHASDASDRLREVAEKLDKLMELQEVANGFLEEIASILSNRS